METPKPQQTYEEGFAEWKTKTSIEKQPLTDYLRSKFEQDLEGSNTRATLAEDGSVSIEKAYAILGG